MSNSFAPLLFALALVGGSTAVQAQPPCDASITIGMQAEPVGIYAYTLQVTPSLEGADILNCDWLCSYPGWLGNASSAYCYLPGAGNYLVTANCLVSDDQQNTCLATGAMVLQVPPDTTGCNGMEVDFSITFNSGTFTFIPNAGIASSGVTLTWDLGDAEVVPDQQPEHTYAQEGHYQVCLTASNGACEKTICKWVYFGSGNVDCGSVLFPSISTIVLDRTVAFIDQSITSGMYSHTTWDFGDGDTGEGPVAVHTYPDPSYYWACAHIELWGPLLADTCTADPCLDLFATGLGVGESTNTDPLKLYPVPFRDRLVVEGRELERGDRWTLEDLSGRPVLQGSVDRNGRTECSTELLPAGAYLFRLVGRTVVAQPVIKQ